MGQEIRNPKYLPGPGLCYGGAVFKAERARIIFIDQEAENIPDTLDPLDDLDTEESLEDQVIISPSKKIKIDMKKRNESERKSASVKENASHIITETQVEEVNKDKSMPNRS